MSPRSSLRERALAGLLWASSGSVVKLVTQLGTSVVLARLLSPTDYGLVAMVSAVYGFLSPLVSMEIGAALIREEQLDARRLATGFWVSLALGVAVTLVLLGCAPLVALYYARPDLAPIARALAFGFLLGALATVPSALLRRELKLRAISIIDTVCAALAGIATIALAYAGYGVWALAAQGLIVSALTLIATWLVAGARVQLSFDRSFARAIVRFGAFASASDFVIMTAASIAQLIIGRALGAHTFGLYMRGMGLAQIPVAVLNGPTNAVMLPVLSQVQREPERFRSVCLRATSLSALALAPILAAFVAVPELVIATLYGPAWIEAAPALRALGIPILLYAVLNAPTTIFPALGRTDLALRYSALTGAAMVAGAWLASSTGSWAGRLEPAAWGHLAILVFVAARVTAAGDLIGLRMRDFVRVSRAPLLAGAMTALATACTQLTLHGATQWVLIPIVAAVGAATYAALTLGLRIDAVQDLRRLVGR